MPEVYAGRAPERGGPRCRSASSQAFGVALVVACTARVDEPRYAVGDPGVATFENRSNLTAWLGGCSPFEFQRHEAGAWVDRGAPNVCVWEGIAQPVTPPHVARGRLLRARRAGDLAPALRDRPRVRRRSPALARALQHRERCRASRWWSAATRRRVAPSSACRTRSVPMAASAARPTAACATSRAGSAAGRSAAARSDTGYAQSRCHASTRSAPASCRQRSVRAQPTKRPRAG